MKILYYSPNPYLNLHAPTGYGTHIREMIYAFEQLGHSVFPLIMGGMDPVNNRGEKPQTSSLPKRLIKQSIPPKIWNSIKEGWIMQKDRQFAATLRQKLQELKPDFVYERAAHLQTSGLTEISRTGIPHIMEVNAPFTEQFVNLRCRTFLYPVSRKIDRRHIAESTHSVVVSTALKNYLSEQFLLAPERMTVLPNAIRLESAGFDKKLADKLKVKYGLENKQILGFVGSIFPWHGVDLLIRAFARIFAKYGNVHLLVVGDGETLHELKRLSNSLKLEKAISFTGSVPHMDVFAYISLMDITFMPNSNWYGSPVKIFEYGAMGKAIIATDNGPIRDVMTDGKDGLLVRPQEDEIAGAIGSLLDKPALRQTLGRNFQKKVQENHNWQSNAEKVLEIVDNIKSKRITSK